MSGMFADRRIARCSVARRAIAGDAGMVEDAGDKAADTVTDAAVRTGYNVVLRFARGENAVVAGSTGIDDAGMLECRRREAGCVMAIVTILLRRDMAGYFAPGGGEPAVVATFATIADAAMGECRWRETNANDMAHVTVIDGRNVVNRFAGGESLVMAGSAVVHNPGVIEKCIDEAGGDMAQRAILRGGNMIPGFARADHPVMAGKAISGDTGMVEDPGNKAAGSMAGAAVFGDRYMIRRQAAGDGPVVAIRARFVDNLKYRVIENLAGGETRGVMAHTAIDIGERVD